MASRGIHAFLSNPDTVGLLGMPEEISSHGAFLTLLLSWSKTAGSNLYGHSFRPVIINTFSKYTINMGLDIIWNRMEKVTHILAIGFFCIPLRQFICLVFTMFIFIWLVFTVYIFILIIWRGKKTNLVKYNCRSIKKQIKIL